MTTVHHQRVAQSGCMVAAVAWAPDGSLLAVGSHDQCIYICDEGLSVHKKLTGATASIVALCFGDDSNTLISNSRDHELLFWDVAAGVLADAGACADVAVSHWTSLLGWPVQGIFHQSTIFKGADGIDVQAVHIPPTQLAVVTGDDHGCVRLQRYPCLPTCEAKVYLGHASRVMGVRFTSDSQYVLSFGGEDHATLQWIVFHA